MSYKQIKQYGFIGILILTAIFAPGCSSRGNDKKKKNDYAIDKSFEKGPLSVHIFTDSNSISLSGILNLKLQAAIEPNYTVQMPKINKALQNFALNDWHSEPDKLGDNNILIKTRTYRLEPLTSGKLEIPEFIFTFNDVNDPNHIYKLRTEPFNIEVTSLLAKDRANLKIEDIETVVEPPAKPISIWIWAGSASAVLALIVIGILVYIRSKRPDVQIRIYKPAHEIAYERMRILVAENLIEKNQVKQFYERINTILRHYIEHRFNLRAPEQTTEEFLNDLKNSNVLTNADKQSLAEFMNHCDLVKFAKHKPDNNQIQQTFNLVKEFIEKTKSDEKKIDVTDSINLSKPEEGEI